MCGRGVTWLGVEEREVRAVGWHEALTDELTGLFNERRFREVLSVEVERARRTGQSVSVVMLDIDDLNAVEERHGHEQARRVMREVSRVLRNSAREGDE